MRSTQQYFILFFSNFKYQPFSFLDPPPPLPRYQLLHPTPLDAAPTRRSFSACRRPLNCHTLRFSTNSPGTGNSRKQDLSGDGSGDPLAAATQSQTSGGPRPTSTTPGRRRLGSEVAPENNDARLIYQEFDNLWQLPTTRTIP